LYIRYAPLKPENIIIGTPDNSGSDFVGEVKESNPIYQQTLFPIDIVQNAIYAKMVEKVGDRKYFEQWAKDVAKIAQIQIDRIKDLIAKSEEHKKAFNNFVKGLQENINSSIDSEEAIEMLSQHIITKPIFEALFENYSFVKNNPISSSMEEILNLLLEQQFEKETTEKDITSKDEEEITLYQYTLENGAIIKLLPYGLIHSYKEQSTSFISTPKPLEAFA